MATDVAVYVCDPRSPWQRGTNENTNGLLRQYFPKGTDSSSVTEAQLNAVACRLNTRRRKTLGFMTPAESLPQPLHWPVQPAAVLFANSCSCFSRVLSRRSQGNSAAGGLFRSRSGPARALAL